MHGTRTFTIGLVTAATLTGGLALGIGSATAHPAKHVAPAKKSATVSTRHTKLGTFLDDNGKTLYLFANDTSSKSTCYGECAEDWPPLLTKGKPAASGGVKAKLLGTTKRKNGTLQVTYNSHPLYLFEGDGSAGETHGEGINDDGGKWYVVNTKGNKIS